MSNMFYTDVRRILSLLRDDYGKFLQSYKTDLLRLRKDLDTATTSITTDGYAVGDSIVAELMEIIGDMLVIDPFTQSQPQSFRQLSNRLADLLNRIWFDCLGTDYLYDPDTDAPPSDSINAHLDIMDTPIPKVQGAGAKTMSLLAESGIAFAGDVLHLLPSSYEMYETCTIPLSEIPRGDSTLSSSTSSSTSSSSSSSTPPYVFRAQYSSGQNIRTRAGKSMFVGVFHRIKDDAQHEVAVSGGSGMSAADKFSEGGVYLPVGTKTNKKSGDHNYTGETITGVWFGNVGYLRSALKTGKVYNLYGTLKEYSGRDALYYPKIIKDNELNIIKAKYSIPKGVKATTYDQILGTVLNRYLGKIGETLPENIRIERGFPAIADALKTLHQPVTKINCQSILNREHVAYKRFVYEELFYHQLVMLMRRVGYSSSLGEVMTLTKGNEASIKTMLPFELTTAQRRVLASIIADISSKHQMNRLLEGDVGSGKTIIAFITCMIAAQNGYQSVIIAPTEVLADQHFKNLTKFLEPTNEECVLLTGSMGAKEKARVKEVVAMGMVKFVVATHAVLEDNVAFANLGMVVVDEQQRFGVLQRKNLMGKGFNPHVLLMTATPIPRTLALAMYGDLDLSVIDEMPPGRVDIQTEVFANRFVHQAHGILKAELEKGHKAYCVYPLISESEALPLVSAEQGFDEMERVFGEYGVGLMHGRLKAAQKRQLIDDFVSGAIQVLVSTTVVEVGVDVKDATVMMINHAERFGLSQLHQLRGRVGRSNLQSHCLLLHSSNMGDNSRKRLDAMVNHRDGFRLAAIDLELRGAGDFFGVNQSGLPNFLYADIVEDAAILELARVDAEILLKDDEFLDKLTSRVVALSLKTKWKHLLEFSFVG